MVTLSILAEMNAAVPMAASDVADPFMFRLSIFVLAVFVITILVGLAIGGVLGHWLLLAAVIIAGAIAAVVSAWTGSRIPGIVVLALSLLTLLFASYS